MRVLECTLMKNFERGSQLGGRVTTIFLGGCWFIWMRNFFLFLGFATSLKFMLSFFGPTWSS